MTNNRKLLLPEREQLILQLLGDEVRTIAELSEQLQVSGATVRRDLLELEAQGKVTRVHGGAIRSTFPRAEPFFEEKAVLNTDAKSKIAENALKFIQNSETIFLDGGSTVLGLAKILSKKRDVTITVVTNSLMAAAELMESGHKLILIGGEFRPLSRTIVGVLTAHTVNCLHIDKAFLGTIGFSLEEGISTTDPNEAYTKELIMKRAAKVILMADSSKLGIPSFATSGTISDIDVIVTDPGIPSALVRELKKKKIEVYYQ